MLINGAISALRKRFQVELNVASTLRTETVTRVVTLVTNSETGETIAEINMLDNGVFSSERVAVASDPITGERHSKTVFGQKGIFSSLRTAETYDRDGHLLDHARHGGELALAADDNDSDQGATQIGRNRFFFRKR
jgi:hypothetical protein